MHTLKMWQSVNNGEAKNIFPYQEEADLMAFSFAYEYQLDKLQIDAMTIGTCWWNQGGWPADIGTECLARDIGSIYSIRELLESGPVYGYYNGEIETNGARIPDAHLIVVTGVDVNNDIIYTNNPWGYSGEQTFEEFMHGFYMSPYENMHFVAFSKQSDKGERI